MISLPTIRDTLAHNPIEPPAPSRSMAAVAMALAGEPDALSLCFILRSQRPGDRWSGQMALPGGKAEAEDATAQAVAIREAREEVGLKLDQAEALGALPSVQVRPAGTLGVLAPFAFYVGTTPPALAPNAGEVEQAWWIPLRHLWNEAHKDTIDWERGGQRMRFPGIRYGEQVIWGLTFRVLAQWSEQLGRPLPGARDEPFRRL
ncbi:MAG: CoA pyrophosphatase [Myxococcota bacterium]